MTETAKFSVSGEEFIDNLIEENKKLKEEVEVWKNANKKLRMHDARMEYENKKLKEENKKLKSDLDFVYIEGKILNNDLCVLRRENEILKEENKYLNEELKKFIKAYGELLKKYNILEEHKIGEREAIVKENKKLKEELREITGRRY